MGGGEGGGEGGGGEGGGGEGGGDGGGGEGGGGEGGGEGESSPSAVSRATNSRSATRNGQYRALSALRRGFWAAVSVNELHSALLLDPLRIRLSRRASARILLCVHKLRAMLCRSAPKNSAASQSEWPGGSAPSAVVGTCTNPVAPAPVQLQAGCQLARRAIRTSCPSRAAAQKVSASLTKRPRSPQKKKTGG